MGVVVKMNTDSKSLVWKSYSNHFLYLLKELNKTNSFSDVTLVCDDNTRIESHKIILSSCSDVLKEIISSDPEIHSVILLTGIKSKDLGSLLQYVYTGETILNQEDVNDFMQFAKELKIGEFKNEVKKEAYKKAEEYSNEDTDEISVLEEISVVKEWKRKEKQITAAPKSKLNPSASSAAFDMCLSLMCPECGRNFNSNASMKVHLKSQHSGISIPCTQCAYKTKTQLQLKKRVKSVHEIHQCIYCNFKTIGQRNLGIHMNHNHFPVAK